MILICHLSGKPKAFFFLFGWSNSFIPFSFQAIFILKRLCIFSSPLSLVFLLPFFFTAFCLTNSQSLMILKVLRRSDRAKGQLTVLGVTSALLSLNSGSGVSSKLEPALQSEIYWPRTFYPQFFFVVCLFFKSQAFLNGKHLWAFTEGY